MSPYHCFSSSNNILLHVSHQVVKDSVVLGLCELFNRQKKATNFVEMSKRIVSLVQEKIHSKMLPTQTSRFIEESGRQA
jgi:hypothetical protein